MLQWVPETRTVPFIVPLTTEALPRRKPYAVPRDTIKGTLCFEKFILAAVHLLRNVRNPYRQTDSITIRDTCRSTTGQSAQPADSKSTNKHATELTSIRYIFNPYVCFSKRIVIFGEYLSENTPSLQPSIQNVVSQ